MLCYPTVLLQSGLLDTGLLSAEAIKRRFRRYRGVRTGYARLDQMINFFEANELETRYPLVSLTRTVVLSILTI